MRVLLVCFCAVLFLNSCQKDTDFGDLVVTPGGNSSGDVIVKTVSVQGTDTSITEIGYDANKRVLFKKDYGKESGSSFLSYAKYYRDGSGRIIKIATKDDSFPDTIYTNLHYPAAGTYNFDYKTIKIFYNGVNITDSAAMEYSNNLLVKEDHYQSGIGTGLTLANRIAYTNNANGDPESVKYYEKQQANMVLSAEIKLTYDDKTNPLNLGNDGLAVNGLVMKHNFTKEEIIDASNPSGNLTVTFVYTYNSKGSPSSATYSSVPTGSGGKISYYYQ